MFQCPSCGNDDTFRILETVRQETTIRCQNALQYEECGVERVATIEWHRITCDECETDEDEMLLRDTYAVAHGTAQP